MVPLGAPGVGVAGAAPPEAVENDTALENALVPPALVALTCHVYEVPLVSAVVEVNPQAPTLPGQLACASVSVLERTTLPPFFTCTVYDVAPGDGVHRYIGV